MRDPCVVREDQVKHVWKCRGGVPVWWVGGGAVWRPPVDIQDDRQTRLKKLLPETSLAAGNDI